MIFEFTPYDGIDSCELCKEEPAETRLNINEKTFNLCDLCAIGIRNPNMEIIQEAFKNLLESKSSLMENIIISIQDEFPDNEINFINNNELRKKIYRILIKYFESDILNKCACIDEAFDQVYRSEDL